MATLRALECLVAVADTGSITQAAHLLHSSQPAVSHQLASLERETRTTLLRREPRGVKLTTAGRAVVADARRAIEAAASAVRAARAVGEMAGGSLRLACAQSLMSVLAPVLSEWHRHHPEVAITLRESTAVDELHGFTDSDEADVVLMPAPVPDRFTTTVVADEEIVLVAPAISTGFQGAVRSFSPRWVRQLVAVTPAAADPLAAQFISDLRSHGVPAPRGVRTLLAEGDSPAGQPQPP